jgi:hypothetical protein
MTLAGMSLAELLKLLAPLIVAEVALKIYCLVALARTEPRALPRWAWALIILVVSGLGSIAYLIFGRKRD